MGFSDNSGDIILDAVLTDTGRRRLARGDGSFKISKFAVGDDEINYEIYNPNHASGSAYYDLEILQTPVLEAITNNTSVLKHKLLTVQRNDHLYLPVIQLFENAGSKRHTLGAYLIAANKDTEDSFDTIDGVLFGERPRVGSGFITNSSPPASVGIPSDLVETQYIVEMDSRLGHLVSKSGARARVSFIDDDKIASYFLSFGPNNNFITNISNLTDASDGAFNGPRGSRLEFKLASSVELNASNVLFTRLGSTVAINDKNGTSTSVNFIDTTVRVTGATTGYSIDIPVRIIKK